MGRFERYIGIGTLKIGELELNVKPEAGDVAKFSKLSMLAKDESKIDELIKEFVNFVIRLVERVEPLSEEDKKELALYIELHLQEAQEKVMELLGLGKPEEPFRGREPLAK